jgi:hypothetical protein
MPVTKVTGIMGKKVELITQSAVTSYKVKRKRPGKYENVEKKLLVWFKPSVALNTPIKGTLVKEKAVEIADRLGVDFTSSNGWLDRFKNRTGLVYKLICGEARSVNIFEVQEWKKAVLYPLLQQYKPCDVFSADELGFFYNLLPNKT